MDNNLPTIQKEGIFKRITNWFKKITGKKEDITEIVETVTKEQTSGNKIEDQDDKFMKALNSLTAEVEVDTEIKNAMENIFNKIQKGEMQLEELSNEELRKIIDIYNQKIEEKTTILNKLKSNSANN